MEPQLADAAIGNAVAAPRAIKKIEVRVMIDLLFGVNLSLRIWAMQSLALGGRITNDGYTLIA